MKKKYILIVLLLMFFIGNNKCKAETFYEGAYIDDAYIKKEIDDYTHYLHSQFVYMDSEDEFVYCIDPFLFINTDEEYDEHEGGFLRLSGLDEVSWAYIVAAAHLGYMAGNHTDPIWYSVTQVVIWQIAEPEADIYFTDGLNGRRIHDYDDMIEELYELIIEYYDMSEVPDNIIVNFNETQFYELNDIYKLDNPDREAGIRRNELVIVGSDIGTNYYTMYKGDEDYVILYTLDDYQNLIWVYDKPYVEKEFSVTTLAGNIAVNLNFEDTYYIACDDNKETIYGVYNENNELVMQTSLSKAKSLDLPYGRYYIKQLSNGCKYLKDDNVYEIILDKKLVSITIDVKQKYKVLHINHNICNNDTCIPEENVTFELEVNNIKKEYKTDIDGNITINTGDVNYIINQLDGDSNYTYSNDMNVDILSYNSDDIYITLNGYLKEANIEVLVVDDNDNNINGAKVCLYDEFDNLIECSYSKDGKVLFEHQLYGKYKVVEEDISSKYILNNEVQEIDLYEDILLKIINQIKPVENEVINDNYEIGSTGEIVNYKEKDIPINNVVNPETGDTNIGFFIYYFISSNNIKKISKNFLK